MSREAWWMLWNGKLPTVKSLGRLWRENWEDASISHLIKKDATQFRNDLEEYTNLKIRINVDDFLSFAATALSHCSKVSYIRPPQVKQLAPLAFPNIWYLDMNSFYEPTLICDTDKGTIYVGSVGEYWDKKV